jgi:hypothetical protein
VRDIIEAGLDENDRQKFPSSLKVTITTGGDLPSDDDELQKLYLIQLQSCETALQSIVQKYEILEETTPTSKTLREAVYPSDLPYDAYKDIKAIISLAAKKLMVVDPYVDSTVVTLLENVQPGVEIQVLTRKMQGDFRLAGQKFKGQRQKAQQGTLEVRKSGKLHDRFVFADDKSFHLGASIKDAGMKMCAMSEFEDSDIKSKLNEIISGYWAEAEIVL